MLMPMFVYINRDPQATNGDLPQEDSLIGMTLEEQGYDD